MTNTNYFSAKSLLLCLLFVPINIIWGQEEGNSSWKLKGFVDTYHAIRTEKPNDFMSSRTRVRGEIGKSVGGSTIFVSFNATHNALLKERMGFELREAYLDHREQHWGFRFGRQLIVWGVADGVRITDVVSPMDMTEFLAQDYDDIRMPVNALRFFVFDEKMKLELLVVPTLEGYKLPTDNENPWSMLPKSTTQPIEWAKKGTHPKFHISNIEYGGKLNFTMPGVDFSIAALHTWNKMPVITFHPASTHTTVSPQYYRMGLVGGDISKPIGQFVLRGEAAFYMDKHFSYKPEARAMSQKGFNTVNYLVGIDWYAPKEWTLMAQFFTESILKYEIQIAQPRHQSILTLNVSKKILDSTLQLSNFTYFDLNDKGWFSRFSSTYALNDHIQLVCGFDWFSGNKGIFSMYKNNSEFWTKAKYSF